MTGANCNRLTFCNWIAPPSAEVFIAFAAGSLVGNPLRVSFATRALSRFADAGYPKLVVEGKLEHSWKEQGKECAIWLTGMRIAGSVTEHGSPASYRQMECNVSIAVRGQTEGEIQTSRYAFMSDQQISYFINGKKREVKE